MAAANSKNPSKAKGEGAVKSDENLKSKLNNLNDGHRQRLRQRLQQAGWHSFSEHEILELLLCNALPRCDTKFQAKVLMARFSTLRNVFSQDPETLLAVFKSLEGSQASKKKAFGMATATYLSVIGTIINEYETIKHRVDQSGLKLNTRVKLERFCINLLAKAKNEEMHVICLEPSYKPIRFAYYLPRKNLRGSLKAANTGDSYAENSKSKASVLGDCSIHLATGDQWEVQVKIRQIIEVVLNTGARSFVITHCHPSSSPNPSIDDIEFTQKLNTVAGLMGLELLDHIIVGRGDSDSSPEPAVYSFRERRQLIRPDSEIT